MQSLPRKNEGNDFNENNPPKKIILSQNFEIHSERGQVVHPHPLNLLPPNPQVDWMCDGIKIYGKCYGGITGFG